MRILVSIAAFTLILAVCFKLNWMALFDPTEPEKNKSILFACLSFLIALFAIYAVNWAFKNFIRFAPTFIGMVAGFWFSIYIITAWNSFAKNYTLKG